MSHVLVVKLVCQSPLCKWKGFVSCLPSWVSAVCSISCHRSFCNSWPYFPPVEQLKYLTDDSEPYVAISPIVTRNFVVNKSALFSPKFLCFFLQLTGSELLRRVTNNFLSVFNVRSCAYLQRLMRELEYTEGRAHREWPLMNSGCLSASMQRWKCPCFIYDVIKNLLVVSKYI